MIKNVRDGVNYCTEAERAALTVSELENTEKYWCVDTGVGFIVYNGAWYYATGGAV